MTMALVYCGTIIVVLSVAAVLLLSVFRLLSINPIMNIGIGLLFVFFALSLFGWYEIELPSSLAQFTSAHEGQGGLVGTMFMALTFTILSFACVAPFLGGFGGTAATGNLSLFERLLGGLAFAVTFAAPFFVLALFPSLLKKLPRSGSWMNSVKVVMGFLELAAAFKFFRLGELVMTPRATIFTYDLVLGVWVALALLCSLYLLGVYRLPHDSPVEHLSVPRLLFAAFFLGLGFYLLPALFQGNDGEKQRPGGAIYAWVDSFLLPEPRESKGSLAWSGNLQAAIEQAREDRRRTGVPKYVFIDFTGKS
jgi:thiol:disulfide interchange protein DsbD